MSSTGTDKASISDVDEALHDKEEKRRKAREACMRYYHKNKARISQQFKDKLKNDEEFKNKVKELNKINTATLRNNEEFREKAKQYNRMYYHQNKAKLLILQQIQNDLDVLKTQLSIPAH